MWDASGDDYLFDPDEKDDFGFPKTRLDGSPWEREGGRWEYGMGGRKEEYEVRGGRSGEVGFSRKALRSSEVEALYRERLAERLDEREGAFRQERGRERRKKREDCEEMQERELRSERYGRRREGIERGSVEERYERRSREREEVGEKRARIEETDKKEACIEEMDKKGEDREEQIKGEKRGRREERQERKKRWEREREGREEMGEGEEGEIFLDEARRGGSRRKPASRSEREDLYLRKELRRNERDTSRDDRRESWRDERDYRRWRDERDNKMDSLRDERRRVGSLSERRRWRGGREEEWGLEDAYEGRYRGARRGGYRSRSDFVEGRLLRLLSEVERRVEELEELDSSLRRRVKEVREEEGEVQSDDVEAWQLSGEDREEDMPPHVRATKLRLLRLSQEVTQQDAGGAGRGTARARG